MKPELLNLWKKNLKANRKYYWAVSSCGMLLLSIVFFTMALGDCMSVIATGRESDLFRGYATLSTFAVTYVLLFGLLVINILSYMKKRYFDYEMFTLLGIKPRHKAMFIAMEYGGITITSIAGGVLAGIAESEILCKILEKLLEDTGVDVFYSFTPHVTTIVMGVCMFGVVFLVLDLMITWFGMAGLLGLGQKGGKPVQCKKLGLLAGGLMFAMAVLNLATYLGKSQKVIPLIMGIVGLSFLMRYVLSFWLLKLKRENHDYYKKLLWLDGWYHQFRHHINLTYVNTAFVIMILSFFMVGFMDNLPFIEKNHYPYDLVWLANQGDEEFLSGLQEKYEAEIISYPCIRVTTPDKAEQTGISESVYQKITGKTLGLEGEEVFLVYQRERSERDSLGIDYGNRNPRLYIGQAKSELWVGSANRASMELNTKYKAIGKEDRVMTGVFKDGMDENMIVFADMFFEEIQKKAEGADLLVLMNAKETASLYEEVKAYAKIHSQKDFFAIKERNLIYEKQEQIVESREEKLMLFTSVCVNVLLLIICCIFVFVEKMKSDEDEIVAKNRFCFLSGMTAKNRKKILWQEVGFSAGMIVFWGVSVSVIFTVIQIMSKHLQDVKWILWYVKGMVISCAACVGLFAILAVIAVRKMLGKAERANENG